MGRNCFIRLMICLFISFSWGSLARGGEVEIRVVDAETGDPLSVRMHLTGPRGQTILPQGPLRWGDHFVFHHQVILDLPVGQYSFTLERGPEYHTRHGYFIIERGASDNHQLTMERFVNMANAGWYSGDMHFRHPLDHVEQFMQSDDLHVAPVVTWSNRANPWERRHVPESLVVEIAPDRMYHVLGGHDVRTGGALSFFQLETPLPVADTEGEFPPLAAVLEQANERPGHFVNIANPTSWDLPALVATGQCDSISVLSEHLQRDGGQGEVVGGRPLDRVLFPPPAGFGRYAEKVYYELLNCGLRISPVAGSGTGYAPNPAGYNRVYAYCGNRFSWDTWWEAVRLGRVVLTNGPVMQVQANNQYPGHEFRGGAGSTINVEIAMNLATQEHIEYLQIIKNGEIAVEVRLHEWAANHGRLPMIQFQESGWFLVRAMTNNAQAYHLALSGAFYVQIGEEPRISRSSAQFFLDWASERSEQIALADPEQQQQVLSFHQAGISYWESLVERATTE